LLTLPGVRAEVGSKNGAVQLTLWGNLPQLSQYPVLESAVALHDNPDVDLDFSLDRGRVALVNLRGKEPVHVRVRVRGDNWDVTLPDKGDEVALELYGRWPGGVSFNPQPKPDEGPGSALTVLVLKGSAQLRVAGSESLMRAPPGGALVYWSS